MRAWRPSRDTVPREFLVGSLVGDSPPVRVMSISLLLGPWTAMEAHSALMLVMVQSKPESARLRCSRSLSMLAALTTSR